MPSIKITPLDVGRSCIIVTIGDKRIMFDCGMHMGYSDAEDMRKILAEKKTEDLFTTQMIKDSFNKVTEISLHQVININGIEIKAYYAGHVLGAVMFKQGDFNMTPDNHLGGAWIDRCEPDILITEATYATTIRESRRCRENDLLAKVHQVIDNGGKVLIPVFALGRAQEICLLLEKYWERKNLKIPIYMSTGMAEKAVNYYKLFISWTNQSIKDSQDERNLFHFKHVQPFDRSLVDTPGPMVVLASPGMLHAGLSCFIFKKWASDPANAIIMAGYCTVGTLGNRVLSGQKRLEIIEHGTSTVLDVNLQVMNMSFSAHADSIGIFQLIDFCRPKKAVILVHADAEVMKKFSPAVKSEYNLNCYCPENGQNLVVEVDPPPIKGLIPREMISRFEAVSNQRFHGYVTIDSNAKYPIKVDSIKHNSSYKEIEFSMSFSIFY